MTLNRTDAALQRSNVIRRSLTRHRLVFVQVGFAFDPIREAMLDGLGEQTSIGQLKNWEGGEHRDPLVVTDLECCAESAWELLGSVREAVFSVMDSGRSVCLVSRAPRLAFQSVPGSSVLEDSALVSLPLLSKDELRLEQGDYPEAGWKLPSVSCGQALTVETFIEILRDFGSGLVAALDHALFELYPKGAEGLTFLSPRELEGLRGGGIVEIDGDGKPSLADQGSLKLLREAVAAHISASVAPAAVLPAVSSGLWFIERKIRNEVRARALDKFGDGWRTSCLGGLNDEVLRRAQLDTNVSAKSVADLRDPLEWLTLGELMDLVRSEKFANLGIEPVIWRKLQEQLVPVRNRIAHVRMLKSSDDETVSMWASMMRQRFGA